MQKANASCGQNRTTLCSFKKWPLRSLPAVKITGDASLPPFPEDSLMVPDSALSDSCLSSEIKLAPLNELSAPMEIKHEGESSLLTDEENADELGEFLLDAVQWL
mmetsp:Transcript_9910/g.13956  ORF Transcript_9910/g.13956 Transcript_9910/m.13956 type:complete len:105 (-) Transcript_9910:168-482(-)